MQSPLFSTYHGGENRVTSSLIAVFERIELSVVERILGSIEQESSLKLVSFVNQIGSDSGTVPDAEISANFRYLFEVKIKNDTVRADQLRGHLAHLTGRPESERLFVITPDPIRPDVLLEFKDDPRVRWTNFIQLTAVIEELVTSSESLLAERTKFLLGELVAFFREEGLLVFADTVVVAARTAYEDYLKYGSYICQPGRSFRDGLTHFGFYAEGEIKPEIPKVLGVFDNVEFSRSYVESLPKDNETNTQLADLVTRLLNEDVRTEGERNQIFLLSQGDDPRTEHLKHPIRNDSRTESGRNWAWTLGQRYTTLALLLTSPKTTSGLDRP